MDPREPPKQHRHPPRRGERTTGFRRSAAALLSVCVAASLIPAGAGAQTSSQAEPAFDDVDAGAYYHQAVQDLAAAGVFVGTGCGADEFCGGEPLERWEMAVWLVRALDTADTASDDAESPTDAPDFVDVAADDWWRPHVERLARLGITRGCGAGPPRFCPHEHVSRAQMATFLARAFDLPPAESAGYGDLSADSVHFDDINRLYGAGITTGCRRDPLHYCPGEAATRAQTATLIDRSLGWLEANAAPPEPSPEPPKTSPHVYRPPTPAYTPPPPPTTTPQPTSVTPAQIPGDTPSVTASAIDPDNWNHEGFPAPTTEAESIYLACGKDCQIRIDAPTYLTPASLVTSLADDDVVTVLDYGGEARAYSINTMEHAGYGYIEVINDTVAGTPVTVAY